MFKNVQLFDLLALVVLQFALILFLYYLLDILRFYVLMGVVFKIVHSSPSENNG